MSIDTKRARRLAEGIYRYTSGNDNAAKIIDDLAYEVERLRKKLDHRKHMDLCREQIVELLEAKSKGVSHEDKQ
jgi:hypothetical protein